MAKMDLWTLKEAVYLIVKLDIQNKNKFLDEQFFPERAEHYSVVCEILIRSIQAGYFSDFSDIEIKGFKWLNWKDKENTQFKPAEIIKWATEKGYEFPPLLLEIMGCQNTVANVSPVNQPDYTTPYIELMKQAIVELKITKDNQPKVETELVPWFGERLKPIEGKQTVNNKAKLMATFVRLPEAQSGGNKPSKKKG